LGEVIHREEFTTLLWTLCGESAATLEPVAKRALDDLLAKNGIADPRNTENVRACGAPTGSSASDLANDVRTEWPSCRKPKASLSPRSTLV